MGVIRLPYGRGTLSLRLESARVLKPKGKITGRSVPTALDRPVALPPLRHWVRPGDKIVIVVPDVTRRCGVHRFIPAILNRIPHASSCTVVFANGLHRKLTRAEQHEILGPAAAWLRRANHDAYDEGANIRVGISPRGIPIELNRFVVEADSVILCGAVDFHYLAGFSGGWKTLVPGIASRRTILGLHRLTLDGGDAIAPGNLTGNIFRDEINAVGKNLDQRVFLINTIVDTRGRIIDAFCGDPMLGFEAGCRSVVRRFSCPVDRRADAMIVSASGYPRDVNLIQSHKAMDHAVRALKPGGMLILVAECSDGLGYSGFLSAFAFGSPERLLARTRRRFHPYARTAWALWTKALRFRIVLVSRLDPRIVKQMRLIPASSLEEALRILARARPKRTYVLTDGVHYLPVVRER